MKLLKVSAKGLDLFKDELVIDLYASQQVRESDTESVSNLFSNIFTNNIISFMGINASGKTSILKVLSFILEFLNAEPISKITHSDIFENSEKVEFEIYFYDNEYIYKLFTEITPNKTVVPNKEYIIINEKLWRKKSIKSLPKKNLFEFNNDPYLIRDNDAVFLKNNISIVISVNKDNRLYYDELINQTDLNILSIFGAYPMEILNFLDPSIEKISFNDENDISLKFYNRPEINLNSLQQLNKYLSSGTIKGLNIFIRALFVFNSGGYLIVDELENHFNIEIVSTLIRLFIDEKVNKKGASLIFSTHYPELIDEFDRNDSIYIIRNKNGIYLEKLSEKLKRNDIKKSEIFKSDYLGGTAPSYHSYMAMKKSLIKHGGK